MKLNLIVIKTHDLSKISEQYRALGLDFQYHRHGKGPFHYSAENQGLVFEIYPQKEGLLPGDCRLGFTLPDLPAKLQKLEKAGWKIISEARPTAWGLRAVIQDSDGRKVELIETEELSK